MWGSLEIPPNTWIFFISVSKKSIRRKLLINGIYTTGSNIVYKYRMRPFFRLGLLTNSWIKWKMLIRHVIFLTIMKFALQWWSNKKGIANWLSYNSDVPRKEYKTITVKACTFYKFTEAVRNAKKRNCDTDNTRFLAYLLYLYNEYESISEITLEDC